MTTIYIPRTETITGANLTGSNGDANRTYTLGYTGIKSGSLLINSTSGLLYEGSGNDYTVSGQTITFIINVLDTMDITIYYTTSETLSSSVANSYGTVQELARFMQIESTIPSPDNDTRTNEDIGDGDGSTTDFFLDKGYIIDDTFTIYYGPSLTTTTALVENTDYDIDLDLGKISLTSTGLSTISTATIYGKYSYVNTTEMGRITNDMLFDALNRAKDGIFSETSNHWANGTNSTPDYIQVTNEKHEGKRKSDRDYFLEYFPLPNVSNSLSADLAITDTTIYVTSTSGFASSGVIGINSNKITYTGKTDNTFTGCTGITTACSDGDDVVPFVIEISTTESGTEPVWEILAKDTGYDLDLESGKVTLLDSSILSTSYGSYPPNGIPNRFRATYIWGNDTIPNDVKRLNLMLASQELTHGVARKNTASGQGELSSDLINIDQAWIDKTLNRLRVGRTFNT